MEALKENELKQITNAVINNSPYGDIVIKNDFYYIGFHFPRQLGNKLNTTKGKILSVALYHVNGKCPVEKLENLIEKSRYEMLRAALSLQNAIKKSYQYELRIPSFLGKGAYITLQEKTNQK